MATTIKNIIPRKQLEVAQTIQYTANGCRTVIDKFTLTNTSSIDVSVSVNLIASGGTAGNSNLVLKSRVIAPGQTYQCPEIVGQLLEDGGFISTLPTASMSITISATGREIT